MRPEDLRIGNVVNQGEFGPQPTKPIDLYLFSRYIDGEPESINYSKWQPIPLSEEWLKKFGLFSDGCIKHSLSWVNYYDFGIYCIYRAGNEFQITVYTSDGENTGMELIKNIRYVHQFQNLYFALTGEELMIK